MNISQHELDKLRDARKWIAFSEALPEPGEMVEAVNRGVIRPQHATIILILDDWTNAVAEHSVAMWRVIK